MATTHTTLTALAHQAAAEIGFTARRWWRDTANPAVLRVEVERRLVGAPPAVAELAVAIPLPQKQQRKGTTAASATSGRKRPTTRAKPTTSAKRVVARGRKKVSTRNA